MKLQPKQILRSWFTGPVQINNESFKRWHIVLAVVFAVQVAVILLFGVAHNVPVMVSYNAKDTLQTQLMHQTITAPAIRQLFSMNISYVLAVYLLVMAGMHVLFGTALRHSYEAALKQRIVRLRWIVYGVVYALMLLAVAFTAGVHDAGTLLGTVIFAAIAGLAGLAGEALLAQPAKRDGQFRAAFGAIAALAAVAPFISIALFILDTNLFGGTTVSGYVYAMLATVMLWAVATVANMCLLSQKRGKWATYAYGERWYLLLSVVLQSLLAWEIFVAVLRP